MPSGEELQKEIVNTNAELQTECSKSDFENDTPVIPEEVYSKLPDVLKNGSNVFTVVRERDIFLTSALTVLSGCFPNIFGLYGGEKVYANLYSFIIAPPASGKGRMKYAREICELIHKERMGVLTANKALATELQPLFIPGNISSSALIEQLQKNDGVGIICESEADTISTALQQDWGDFSDILRKAFHHESISLKRRKGGEYIEVTSPKLSCAITGTPDQIKGLIPSVNNGLVSRFLYYYFTEPAQKKEIGRLAGKINLSEHFAEIASEVLVKFQKISQHSSIEFLLTDDQFTVLNSLFKKYEDEAQSFINGHANSLVNRLQLMSYKIAMVLSVLSTDLTALGDRQQIKCKDQNFEIALALSEIYFQHAIAVFRRLSAKSNCTSSSLKGLVKNFYDLLGEEFSREKAIEIAKGLSIKERTAANYLKQLVETKHLEKLAHGKYKKFK